MVFEENSIKYETGANIGKASAYDEIEIASSPWDGSSKTKVIEFEVEEDYNSCVFFDKLINTGDADAQPTHSGDYIEIYVNDVLKNTVRAKPSGIDTGVVPIPKPVILRKASKMKIILHMTTAPANTHVTKFIAKRWVFADESKLALA